MSWCDYFLKLFASFKSKIVLKLTGRHVFHNILEYAMLEFKVKDVWTFYKTIYHYHLFYLNSGEYWKEMEIEFYLFRLLPVSE